MRRTNRVEPGNNSGDGLKLATMITTTHMEITRRVEVVPIKEPVTQLHTETKFPSRLRTDMHRVATPVAIRSSRKTLFFIGCLFITAGILALSVAITGFTIAFEKINLVKRSDIERYDVGDLHYGMNNVNQTELPSYTYLTNVNKDSIEKYLSDQLIKEAGFRGLFIDEVFVRHPLRTKRRNQRDTSCSTIFIVRNIQVYFDQCSTCTNERNLVLSRSFSNITAFRKQLYLLINDRHVSTQICSISTISRFIVPIRLNILLDSKYSSMYMLTSRVSPRSILPPIKTRSLIATTIQTKSIRATSPLNLMNTLEVVEEPPEEEKFETTSHSTDFISSSIRPLSTETSTIDLDEILSSTIVDLSTMAESDSFPTEEKSASFTTNQFDIQTSTKFFDESSTPSYTERTSLSSRYISSSKKSVRQSSIATTKSLRKTTWNMFQFLPYRPITRRFNNSFATTNVKHLK